MKKAAREGTGLTLELISCSSSYTFQLEKEREVAFIKVTHILNIFFLILSERGDLFKYGNKTLKHTFNLH